MDELICPACGKCDWYPIMEWRGYGYVSYEAVIGIECNNCNKEYVI